MARSEADTKSAYDRVVDRIAGFRRTASSDDPMVDEMRRNRAVNRRTAAATAGPSGGGSVNFATGRPRDPLFYWKQNNLPYDLYDHQELKRVRAYMRLLYQSHPLISSCIDIYSEYPLLGLELKCFAAETPVITDQGVREISTLSGDVHHVLTRGGNWVQAKFDDYGIQRLWRVTVRRNRRERTFYATAGHRWYVEEASGPGRGALREGKHSALTWDLVDQMRAESHTTTQRALASRYGISQPMVGRILRGLSWTAEQRQQTPAKRSHPQTVEYTTEQLTSGQRLTSVYATNRLAETNPSPFGVARGMVFGDGSLSTLGGGPHVDLHGEKDAALLPYFAGCTTYRNFTIAEDHNVPSVRVSSLPAYFKTDRPDLDEGISYLYGWLAGYFAADGTVSRRGEVVLDSVSHEAIEHARAVCQRLGIKTYDPHVVTVPQKRLPNGRSIRDWTGYRLPIDPGSLTEAFFVIEEHRKRWLDIPEDRARREDWTVVSVEETDRVETVYCAQVPGTESFALEGNILTGNCKDDKLTDFYSDLFLSEEGLNYGDWLMDFGREFWTVGEAVPFGSFNEVLGIWDDDELLNPDDLEVVQSPFLKEPRYFIKLPETLREIITKRTPVWEYEQLMAAYPELAHYTAEDALMPVSSILLRHYRFKGDTFNKRGVPLTMRSMRSVMQEEMLNAARDAVADRLYTPLILARLGASATDLGTTQPWIPTPEDLADFEESLDAALAADFRVLIHHFGVQMDSVFGSENLPDFIPDFEQLEDRMLQTFGLSKTMLTGASSGQTYAADALNRDLVSQLLTKHQKRCKAHYRQRALVVAEAQEHYDYDERNGKRYVKMEEILEIDEKGNERIVEQPKLLIPEMSMKTMNIKDDEAQREFLEQLRASGIPISMKTRMINVPIDLQDEIETSRQEAVDLAVAEQETRKAVYLGLKDQALPIPPDLRADFEPRAANALQPSSMGLRVPMMGIDPVTGTPTMAPTAGDFATPTDGGVVMPGVPATPVDPFTPAGDAGSGAGDEAGDQSQRPEESDEMREDMPKAAYKGNLEPAPLHRAASRMRAITAEHYRPPAKIDDSTPMRKVTKRVFEGEGEDRVEVEREVGEFPDDGIARGGYADPKHIGMRRYAFADKKPDTWIEHGTFREVDPDEV